jgi:hypothetical protein
VERGSDKHGAELGHLRGARCAARHLVRCRPARTGASLGHTVVRLATDQTLENVIGVGAPPHTWPRRSNSWTFCTRAVYSFSTVWSPTD